MTTPYPLAALSTVRDQRAHATALDLGAALADEARAQAAVDAASARRAAGARAAQAATLVEDQPLPAWAIARRAAYAVRLRRDLERATAALASAQDDLSRAQAVVTAARGHATLARGEREVVDRHQARWTEAQRRARDRRDEP